MESVGDEGARAERRSAALGLKSSAAPTAQAPARNESDEREARRWPQLRGDVASGAGEKGAKGGDMPSCSGAVARDGRSRPGGGASGMSWGADMVGLGWAGVGAGRLALTVVPASASMLRTRLSRRSAAAAQPMGGPIAGGGRRVGPEIITRARGQCLPRTRPTVWRHPVHAHTLSSRLIGPGVFRRERCLDVHDGLISDA